MTSAMVIASSHSLDIAVGVVACFHDQGMTALLALNRFQFEDRFVKHSQLAVSVGAVEVGAEVHGLESLHRHVLEVSLGWTLQVPFPHQKGFISRFQKLFGILWGIFVDAPVQSRDAVQVTVLTGKNSCPTR